GGLHDGLLQRVERSLPTRPLLPPLRHRPASHPDPPPIDARRRRNPLIRRDSGPERTRAGHAPCVLLRAPHPHLPPPGRPPAPSGTPVATNRTTSTTEVERQVPADDARSG